MKRLLQHEIHKLIRQKSFYICTTIILVMTALGLMVTKSLTNNLISGIPMPSSALDSILSAVSISDFPMLCGIFIALFICTDYTQMTIKNVYARGFSRTAVYLAKSIISIAATTVMFAVTLIFTYIFGKMLFNGTSQPGNYIGLIVGQLTWCIAYASFALMVSLIVKKPGVSIALIILGPSLIGTVLHLADTLWKMEKFNIGNYWLDELLEISPHFLQIHRG